MRTWRTAASAALALSLVVTACGMGGTGAGGANGARQAADGMQSNRFTGNSNGSANTGLPDGVRPLHGSSMFGMLKANAAEQPVSISYIVQDNKKYVSVDTIAELLEFEHNETAEDGWREIGDTDVLFRLKPGSKEAEIAGERVTLPDAPILINGKLVLSVAAAADVFAEEMVFDVTPNELVVYPADDIVLSEDSDDSDFPLDESWDFADDPDDPFKDAEVEGVFNSSEEALMAAEALEAIAADPEAQEVLKNIDINGLIATAKKYLGVPYDFGAEPYPESKGFDCSSYTQYVFGQYGIDLPRTARAQMREGKTVSRKHLRKGDLLFFYVPGRFKSNKVAGHVGIYIGNRKMIHSNTKPKDGVQIRSIDRPYWKKTFLKAKRIAY